MDNRPKILLIVFVISFSLLVIGVIGYYISKYMTGYSEKNILLASRNIKNNPGYISNIDMPITNINCDGEYEVHISFWLYIEDISYNYGYLNPILNRGKQIELNGTYDKSEYLNNYSSCPAIFMDETTNNMLITLELINIHDGSLMSEIYSITDVPVKEWTHYGFNIDTQYLSVFYNGKLAHTYTIDSNYRPNFNSLYQLHVGEKGGIDGKICKLHYLSRNISTDELVHNYLRGPLDTGSGCPNRGVLNTGLYDTYTEPLDIKSSYFYDNVHGLYVEEDPSITGTKATMENDLKNKISELENEISILRNQRNT